MASSTLFQQVVRKYLVSKIGIRPTYYDILKSCGTQRLGWTPWQTFKESALRRRANLQSSSFPILCADLERTAATLLLPFVTTNRSWNSKVSVWVPPTPRKWLLGLSRKLVLELVQNEDEALPIIADWLEDHGEYPRAEVLRLYLQEKENRDG